MNNYPQSILFWDKTAKLINFINPEDFRTKKLLQTLGLEKNPLVSSFGATDSAEILRRQKIAKFCLNEDKFRKFFAKLSPSFSALPIDGQNFINKFFNKKKTTNPFFDDIENFITILEEKKLPQELKDLVDFLKTEKTTAKALETETWQKMLTELKKVTYVAGAMEITWDFNGLKITKHETQGYKKYSLGEVMKTKTMPKWTNKKLMRVWPLVWITNIIKYFTNKTNEKIERLFYSTYLIDKPLPIFERRIIEFIKEKLKSDKCPGSYSKLNEVTLNISYSYSERGLIISLNDVNVVVGDYGNIKTNNNLRENECFIFADNLKGYSRKEMMLARKKNTTLAKKIFHAKLRREELKIFQHCVDCMPQFGNNISIASPEIDLELRWNKITDLYKLPEFVVAIDKITAFRNYVATIFMTLKDICDIIDILSKNSKEWKYALNFPKLLEDEKHLTLFEDLMPISLIGKLHPKDLVPIKGLPPLNGQMFGFTGQNAGGKSVAQQDIASAIYLAQSGLPIFAKNFTLNAKKTLGAVFVERGDSSTAELLLIKTKNILDALENIKENGIFLVLDEIGTGTGEIDGLDYGKQLLKNIADRHVSTIFATQITDLAKFAETNLDATMFKFNLNHEITPGIGTGNLSGLIEKIGLNKYFREKA